MGDYNLSENDIISKLALIEKHLNGFNRSFYEPSVSFNPSDIISVQKEASNMMRFVGLNNYTPVITYTNTGEKVGGNIDLNDKDNVFIEINQRYKHEKDQTLAVMAHEICHKVLFVHNLYLPIELENELLTDISTIYVGFGKLSMNGCYKETITKTTTTEGYKEKEVTTTHTESIGYLSRKQFAQAYAIVCDIYNISYFDRRSGLNQFALSSLKSTFVSVNSNYTKERIIEKQKSVQKSDAELTKSIIIIENILKDIKAQIIKNHKQYRDDFVLPFSNLKDEEIMNKQIAIAELFSKYQIELYSYENNSILKDFISHYSLHHNIDYTVLFDIKCPLCGHTKKNAIKDNKEIFLKCPNCGYIFLWDAEIESKKDNSTDKSNNNVEKSETSLVDEDTPIGHHKNSIWKSLMLKFKGIFGKKKVNFIIK